MAGPVGYIFHSASGKLIHENGRDYDPPNGPNMFISKADTSGSLTRLQYRFIPQEGEWGYIKHVSSGRVVQPLGEADDSLLILLSDRNDACLFKFDQVNLEIVHKSGKYWHPQLGPIYPADNTPCVLHRDRHEAAKFYFGDCSGKLLSAH